jgi:hypothetical protein
LKALRTVPFAVVLLTASAAFGEAPSPSSIEETEENRFAREEREKREAQYARNRFAIQVGFGREVVKARHEITGWSGRTEFAMVIPMGDGAAPLVIVQVGFSGWSSEEEVYGEKPWGFGFVGGAGYGYRTPWLIGYAGLSFGAGFDHGEQPAAGAYGGFANAGFDLMGVRLLGDVRAEYRTMKADASRWHLTYGGLVSVDL